MDCDEHIILKKLRDGDSEALDILYLRYASKVRDFAFRLLKDRTDAEDVTHDIFLKIWEQRRGLGAVLSFRGYLFRTSAMIEAMLRLTAFTDTRLSGLMSASM